MESNKITAQIKEATHRIPTALGPGFLETVYEVIERIKEASTRIANGLPKPSSPMEEVD